MGQSPAGQAAQAQTLAWLEANQSPAQEPEEADEDILASDDLETALEKLIQ